MPAIDERYFVYENRLASFKGPQPVGKRRASNASSRASKTLHWPHNGLSPVDLAKAGFVFRPLPDNPDNVVCFLCHKSLDGWEEQDSPLVEHLRHSPDCGWAITVAIEAEVAEYAGMHPLDQRMLDARKATFAGRWPYEAKKGFKCKTKQLVEAGWKYTPTLESDDMATCAYCQLALDGWESGDKPVDEHYKRSPACPFFALLEENPAPAKKAARTKTTRGSKASSRLSMQSVATATSVGDVTADHDDSVLTTTSVLTQGGTRKSRTTRRAAPLTVKTRKTRAKKDDAVEMHDHEPQDTEMPPPPLPKPARGRKRASDAMDEPAVTAPKKQARRAKISHGVDSSVLQEEGESIAPGKPGPGRKKGRASTAKSRKASSSSLRSQASTASLRARVPDDDELDRQLQADLERPLTEDEDLAAHSDSEKKKEAATATATATATAPLASPPEPGPTQAARGRPRRGTTTPRSSTSSQKQSVDDYAMFDPAPLEVDDDVRLSKKRFQSLRRAGNRALPMEDGLEPGPEPVPKDRVIEEAVAETEVNMENAEAQSAEGHDTSSGTVVTGETSRLGSARVEVVTVTRTPAAARTDKSLPPPPPPSTARQEPQQAPATPRVHATPSAKQAALSPSQSPQASDAENQPPSSKPARRTPAPIPATAKRVVLAATPARGVLGSPSRRPVIGGLQSTTPWAAADLDALFPSPVGGGGGGDGPGTSGVEELLRQGSELTSPEKRMTVEEWVLFNAGQADLKLRQECEAMVSAFEREGGRAMAVLEGLVVDCP
ncbi:hypothetical protein P8C59_005025 [Phyllachora maydis]|uniref:Uncharacterized protein n=1 Tax=Phyllachora maydis TaxID=1825666 RepID=A0AAD9I4P7_9PEZI|nr:hypothetical protein P8C59_005025 [Phyllachora maydis]